MANKQDNYGIITDKIHSIKEEFTCLKNKKDDYAFSALVVKSTYYKNPSLSLTNSEVEEMIVDGGYDGGVDFMLSDPNSEASDLIIGQSKYYKDISFEVVKNAVIKMLTFYNDMKEGHYEYVNNNVQQRFLTLDAEVGEESKVWFVFSTSAEKNGIRTDRVKKAAKEVIGDSANIEIVIQFGEDIVESIKELESRRPTVESGKIKIDTKDNYLVYGDEAMIANVSAFSLKQLYAQHGNNVLSRNLRYHVAGRDIDRAIENTIKTDPESFWFKNNGITIICDSFYVDGKEIKLKNFSIVNGGQTTYMIHKSNDVVEDNDFYLPCKIIKTVGNSEDEKNVFSLEIAKATNSQKAIKPSDLRSNSPEQVRFTKAMRDIGVFYETKRGEDIPKAYKLPYLNTDIADTGKLCMSGIFQMPGTSRNRPSTYLSSPYYETIFDSNQKQISKIVKELLYINEYWNKTFKKKFTNENKDAPNYMEIMPFFNNSRTLCISFAMLASRYYHQNFDASDINTILKGIKNDADRQEFNELCKELGNMDFVISYELLEKNKDVYDDVLYELFNLIIDCGYTTYSITNDYGDATNATNYLKKDESYYSILKSNWKRIEKDINKIFSSISFE